MRLIKYKGTSIFAATLRLITSVALAGLGLYVSFLWMLRDMPDLALISQNNMLGIFLDIMVPLILLGLSYGVGRDSLLDFFDVLRRRKRIK